jgi:hypothetical protein
MWSPKDCGGLALRHLDIRLTHFQLFWLHFSDHDGSKSGENDTEIVGQ